MEDYKVRDVSVLEHFVKPVESVLDELLIKEFQEFHRKVVVLDDDPTGVQTVHDVSVYTDWSEESLTEGMQSEELMFFILTNSRSFSAEKTKAVHKEIAENLAKASKATARPFLLISRGDSTLRGHYPLETEILRDALEKKTGIYFSGEILCPFFREGGRYTMNGVHYVKEGDSLVPAAQTEFAKDKTFGYEHSHLAEYIEEKTSGRVKTEEVVQITIGDLRRVDLYGIEQKLREAMGFHYIIVDAVDYSDIKIFAIALLRMMKSGAEYLIRSAAAIPKILGQVSDQPLLTKEQLTAEPQSTECQPKKEQLTARLQSAECQPEKEQLTAGLQSTECQLGRELTGESRAVGKSYGGIVLVGSHVKKTTAQLESLRKSAVPLVFIEFDVNTCHQEQGLEREAERAAQEAERTMEEGKTAVVYTSRTLYTPENATKEQMLSASVQISDAVTSVIARLQRKPRFIIAKGGITSSDVGTKALAVRKAKVLGQVQPGIPVWLTGPESKFPGTAYIIFPGNVGDEDTLRKILEELS